VCSGSRVGREETTKDGEVMANHVYFTMHLDNLDENFNDSVLSEKVTRKDYDGNPYEVTELVEIEHQPFMSKVEKRLDKDGELEDSYDWYCDNVGAKWCHIEECQDGYISGYSAWRQPHELMINIMEYYAEKLGECFNGKMTYEDEFRNFMGTGYYSVHWDEDDGYYAMLSDYAETDGTALMEQFDELYPSLKSSEDDFEWHEEHEVDGETIYPYEVLDELADEFWERC